MKQEISIYSYPKRCEQKNDGKCPLMGRLHIGDSTAQFSTKLLVSGDLWANGRMKGKSKEAVDINNALDRIVASVHRHYRELSMRYENVDARQVKERVQGMAIAYEQLLQVFAAHNEEYRKRIGIGKSKNTWSNYNVAYIRLADFLKQKYRLSDIPFHMLDRAFIDKYDHYLKYEHGMKPSTVLNLVNALRRMVKIAIGKGIIDRDPFAGYSPERIRSEARYLSKSDFEKLLNVELKKDNLKFVRDMFVFASFTGLSYSDMCNLKNKDIREDDDGMKWIMVYRQKSKNPSNIPLVSAAEQIIEKYRGIAPDPKLFPMLSCSKTNLHLKKIAKECGFDFRLTFHMSRHTFATQHTLSRGVPIESVSHMLGHTSVRSTQIYAEVTSEKIHREMRECKQTVDNKFKLANL